MLDFKEWEGLQNVCGYLIEECFKVSSAEALQTKILDGYFDCEIHKILKLTYEFGVSDLLDQIRKFLYRNVWLIWSDSEILTIEIMTKRTLLNIQLHQLFSIYKASVITNKDQTMWNSLKSMIKEELASLAKKMEKPETELPKNNQNPKKRPIKNVTDKKMEDILNEATFTPTSASLIPSTQSTPDLSGAEFDEVRKYLEGVQSNTPQADDDFAIIIPPKKKQK